MTASSGAAEPGGSAWQTMTAEEAVAGLGSDARAGLGAAEAATRLHDHGSNTLDEAPPVPLWRKLVRLLLEPMTIVLIAAAAVSAIVSREWETPIVILLVIVLNTVLNLVQEARASSSLDALKHLAVETSRVVRDGTEQQLDRSQLVPGDVVVLEAGDSVPADGRLLESARLAVAESALTGEAVPVEKSARAVHGGETPLGERSNLLFMHTEVTRGRARMLVTETGMRTEIGRIATLLGGAGQEKTPLQHRIDHLARLLTIIALAVVVVVFVLGLVRGLSWEVLLITAVSLAVATIPEGLTAVVAFTLAMGANRLAKRGAIIKQLAAVETLGSTSQIATDKTGTLTLNQMTVRRLSVPGHEFRVSGEGYAPGGAILATDDLPTPELRPALLAMGLCNDATVRGARVVGDPTDGALVVLAEKGGIDVEGARRRYPRVDEVPFDADYRFQSTLHERPDGEGLWLCVKGAPQAVLERATALGDGVDEPRALSDAEVARLRAEITELAESGMRTLLIAGRRLDAPPGELFAATSGLTLYALVGIVDPPRAEAGEAIAEAQRAGITVHMITGDHLVTAASIAADLGIPGESASGAELDELDDGTLLERSERLGVLARVAPEHKIRMVRALQTRGEIVAMTGDGVNDAPALKQADIGVAMGITGTDVAKGAAKMILTDDNFATIVAAIREGRGIYANIVRFVRFQLTTAWSFVGLFFVCSVFAIAGGAPFTALQILWVNIIMDGPPAMALGVEPTEPDVMRRPPRSPREPLLTPRRLTGILLSTLLMVAGTLVVLLFGASWFPASATDPRFVTSLAFNTFVFFQLFNLLNVRSERTVFSVRTFQNPAIGVSLVVVLVLQVLLMQTAFMQGLFSTTSLTSAQWAVSIAIGSSILWVEEARKLVRSLRRRASDRGVGPEAHLR